MAGCTRLCSRKISTPFSNNGHTDLKGRAKEDVVSQHLNLKNTAEGLPVLRQINKQIFSWRHQFSELTLCESQLFKYGLGI